MRLFWGFASMEFRAAAMYRLEFWLRILGNLVGMYGAYWVWNTLYAQQPQSFPVSLAQMLTYGMLAMALDSIFYAAEGVNGYITNQVRSGALGMDLLRPLDLLFHLLARSMGTLLFRGLTLGLPGVLVGVLFLGLRPPASPVDGLMFLLSLAPAYLVAFSLRFLLGMVSVYTIEARQISWVYFSVEQFLSGQFVPLWIFPAALGRVVGLLPFHGIIGVPMSIYIGQLSPVEAGRSLALQVFWAAALLALCRLVWHHAHTRLTVQGG